jgi:AcrR family transcriptional regulator
VVGGHDPARRREDRVQSAGDHEHFSSKEQIVIELLRRGFREMLAAMRAARDAHADPDEALLAIGGAYYSFSAAHPEMHFGMHGETAFEACMVRPYFAGAKDGRAVEAPPRHRPFEEVHDREEWYQFFRSRAAKIPEDEPFPETREIFVTVRDALERALGARGGDLESLSWKVVTLWGATHGLVTLAMAGLIPNGRDAGADLVAKMGRDLLAAWRAEAKPWRPDAVRGAMPAGGQPATMKSKPAKSPAR